MEEATRRSQVEEQLSVLDKSRDRLFKSIEALGKSLESITRPGSTQVSGEDKPQVQLKEKLVKLASRLEEQAISINSAARRIESIVERLEL